MEHGHVVGMREIIALQRILQRLVKANGAARDRINHVAFQQQLAGARIDKEAVALRPAEIHRHIVNVVAAEHRPRLPAERVYAAAIGQRLHDMMNVVVLDPILFRARGRGIPLPAHGNTGVGKLADLVVRHFGLRGDANPNAYPAKGKLSAPADVAIGHTIAAGNFVAGDCFTDVDAVATDVVERAVLQLVLQALAAKPNGGAAEMAEGAVLEGTAAGEVEREGRRNERFRFAGAIALYRIWLLVIPRSRVQARQNGSART